MPLCLASLQALSGGVIERTAIYLDDNSAACSDESTCTACRSMVYDGLSYGCGVFVGGLVCAEVRGCARIRHRQEVSDALMDILRGMDKFSWKAFETAYSLYH